MEPLPSWRMELTAVVGTDAGMHALWDVAVFEQIDGYEAWARELEEEADLERHIQAGSLVPINIRSDGMFSITIRADPTVMPGLQTDEGHRVVATSEPYRLTTSGRIGVSGIEYVGHVDDRMAEARLDPGDYDVIVHLMDYDDIADRGNEHPDFLITVGPPMAGTVRTSVETFLRG